MLVREALLPKATELLLKLYQKEIAISVPHISWLLDSVRKLDTVHERTTATFLQVRLAVKY